LKKFSYDFWDNQWFGWNQIYLKLKLGACCVIVVLQGCVIVALEVA
jgi:hypothetical protein